MNDKSVMNLIVRFRLATVFFAVFLSFYFEKNIHMNTNLIIIGCLIVSNIIMLYFTKNEDREKAIFAVVMMEAIGIAVILINSSSYFGYYFWMLLNPILLSIIKLKGKIRNIYILFSMVLTSGIWGYTYLKTRVFNLSDAHIVFGFLVVLCFVIVIAKIFDKLTVVTENLELKNLELEKSYQAKEILAKNLFETTALMDDLTYSNSFKQSVEILTEHFLNWKLVQKKFLLLKTGSLTEVIVAEGIDDLEGVLKSPKVIKSSISFDDQTVIFGVIVEDHLKEEINQHLLFIKKLFIIQSSRLKLLNYHDDLLIEKERNRIAEQIHDQVNQKLFASACLLYNVESQIKSYNNDLLNKQIDTLREMLKGTNVELKDIIYKMSLYKGHKYLQRERMVNYIKDLSMIYGVEISVQVLENFDDFGEDVKYNLFRVINESIVNAVNHGKCNHIKVNVIMVDDDVILEIDDNGCGFDTSNHQKSGLGLKSMENISIEYGGKFEINSNLGLGTQVKMVISG